MPSPAQATPEADRIAFLLQRDGYEATHAWVERTLKIYRDAVRGQDQPIDSHYRPLFERSIAAFEEWLQQNADPAARTRLRPA